jgi:tetratricopeptide (TPR) repeat protein
MSQQLSSGDQAVYESGPVNLSELNFLLAELYMRQYRYYEARELLEWLKTQGWQCKAAYTQNKGKGQGARGKKKPISAIPGSDNDTYPGPSPTVEELLQTCREKIGAWEERKARMGDLLKRAEEGYGGSLESGLFYFRLGNYERAVKAYLDAADEYSNTQSPQLVAAFYGLAHTYLKLKANQKAVDAFAGALQTDPNNPLIYRDLAVLAIENGNHDSAEIFLTRALELAPLSNELYTLLANLYLRLGESKKAIALYEYGLQLNHQSPELQEGLALLYQDLIQAKR